MTRILMPLPSYGFDPTEAAVPWQTLIRNNQEVVFATPEGNKSSADERMLTGKDLGLLRRVLAARHDAVAAYAEMENTSAFSKPIRYSDARVQDFDALLLPGGHDKGVREYLESDTLKQLVADFFIAKKAVGAICHGTVLVARSIDPLTMRSVIYNYKTTGLLKSQELTAYNMTRLWLADYYLTYPGLTVEDEVSSALSSKDNFLHGPLPLLKDNIRHLSRGFVVKDRNYLSGRWPGDAYTFSLKFSKMVG